MRQQRIRSLLAPILMGLGMIRVASPDEPAYSAAVAVAANDPHEADKAAIHSVLVDYCRYALETTSNDVARCQLYAHWGRALERKLRLQKTDFATIRRAVIQPYLAGFQAAAEYQDTGAKVSTTAGNASEIKDRKERLTEFRLFFRREIVALYSQPPVDFEELENLVSKSVPDESVAQEIIEADEFKSLRARHH